MKPTTGAAILCSTLERLGVTHVFGVPGTQNVSLFEALRTSSLRTITAVSELSASMMANGYYRASGKVGILVTIPGPGFTFAISGIAEASQDSAAILYITGKPACVEGKRFALQAIDQRAILKPLVRNIVEVDSVHNIEAATAQAYTSTICDEPGPVLLQIDERVMSEQVTHSPGILSEPSPRAPTQSSIAETALLLAGARRVVIYAGLGAVGAYRQLKQLAMLLNAPVIPTRSARGALSDDHPLSLVFDQTGGAIRGLNLLLGAADLVIAIGCKFSHNGSYGFRIQLDPTKLIHVDASPLNLNVNYPARLAICADATLFLSALLAYSGSYPSENRGWPPEELKAVRQQGIGIVPEPALPAITPSTPQGFFAALRAALPDNSCVVTDSGQHQVLATRYFKVRAPRGLIIPSDFQSMGFGLPAAIGAKLADPERAVVALIGDGGLLMSGFEIATAIRENVSLTVVVFNDGALGQIRTQQHSSYGRSFATDLLVPDLELFARSIGARHVLLHDGPERVFQEAFAARGVTILEVLVERSAGMRLQQLKGFVHQTARRSSRFDWIVGKLRAFHANKSVKAHAAR